METADCIFCNYEEKYVIKETNLAIATYFPRAIKKGHFVVAIKEHLPTFTNINTDQAKAVIELALEISKAMEKLTGAEKTYIAAIGDKDLHFHIHLFPKLKTDAPMGIHIMTDKGWKGVVGQEISELDVQTLIDELKRMLN
ncbi:MAG: HIT family protein [Candidatus Bathyarchaeota archaeon]|uniref:HIT family protein n=1 Tax=Candidatus Bathycorpusculum sp. TaxID=2994959 RepID=UPI0028359CA1|nr:HIT family protein [Candidatus Termiticorpusculum sp.]MCL2291677.1 HIT family protein [Candidatus Termiticorpusculum sp.]